MAVDQAKPHEEQGIGDELEQPEVPQGDAGQDLFHGRHRIGAGADSPSGRPGEGESRSLTSRRDGDRVGHVQNQLDGPAVVYYLDAVGAFVMAVSHRGFATVDRNFLRVGRPGEVCVGNMGVPGLLLGTDAVTVDAVDFHFQFLLKAHASYSLVGTACRHRVM